MFKGISIFIVCITLLSFAIGCGKKNEPKEVAQIIYLTDSGPILPELQMHEEFAITRTGIELTRRGKSSNTKVFEGEWAFTSDEALLADLFVVAEGGDCAAYKRVESTEPLDGGDTYTLIIRYSDGSECTLTYDPGTSYEGAEGLLSKVREVIKNLKVQPNVVPE